MAGQDGAIGPSPIINERKKVLLNLVGSNILIRGFKRKGDRVLGYNIIVVPNLH